MIQFAEVFPDEQIVVSLIRQLSWTHFIALIPLKDPLKRDFYAEMCRIEKWNVKTLRKKIDSNALSNRQKPYIIELINPKNAEIIEATLSFAIKNFVI